MLTGWTSESKDEEELYKIMYEQVNFVFEISK